MEEQNNKTLKSYIKDGITHIPCYYDEENDAVVIQREELENWDW